jgi:primary-amine oxidase
MSMKRINALCACLLWVTSVARAAEHPLEPLAPSEIQAAFEVVQATFLADQELPDQPLRFSMVVLAEPPKSFVLGWTPGTSFPRSALVQVLHYPSNRLWVAEVDLLAHALTKIELRPAGTQGQLTSEEFVAASDLIYAYEPFSQAIRKRGLEPSLTYIDVWAPGDAELDTSGLSHGKDTRLARCIVFYRGADAAEQVPESPQNPYDGPIEGIVITVDLNARKVIELVDTGVRPVISESGNASTSRRLKPLTVTQPEGSDIQLHGHTVQWQRWKFYAALHPREGLVLYDVRFDDRPIAYRLALSEIYVPYGMGDDTWLWRSAFDVGEYNAGMLAQALEVDRDVPENTQFLDAVFFSDIGVDESNPTGAIEYPATVGLYERDSGILWTRTDPTNVQRDTRMGRELVVTWNCWIGNYIYAFDWVFKLDGSIEVVVHLTGTTLNRGTDATPEAEAPKVGLDADGVWVAAPNHQHFLSFRLDLDVDGTKNALMEMSAAHLPETGFKNAFGAVMKHIAQEGYRDADPFTARHWHIESADKTNKYGKPTSYALEPSTFAVPYSAEDFPGLLRAEFAKHPLWFTRYREGELYAAGEFPNQGQKSDGVGVYTTPAEPLHGDDVVLWYTTGFTHLSKPEDYPVMPSESIHFKLQPRGFFSANPALEIADQVE